MLKQRKNLALCKIKCESNDSMVAFADEMLASTEVTATTLCASC